MMGEAAIEERISEEVMLLIGTSRRISPFSARYPRFDFGVAYRVVARVRDLRKDRGEFDVGRKIGFTNSSIWGRHGISAPIWNYIFDRTLSYADEGQSAIEVGAMPEPRIEPELVLHLASAPAPGMTLDELLRCVDWVAPGFEIVYSIFPNWDFTARDAAAACGLHGALLVGEKLYLNQGPEVSASELSSFSMELENDKGVRRQGRAEDVLGGPLLALRFLVEEISRFPVSEPLRAGEVVTTGTLTEAMPARAGDTWCVRFEGIEIGPFHLRIV